MKILVIGANGFIGRKCVSYFKQKGYNTYGASVSSQTRDFNIKSDYSNIKLLFQQQFDCCINASGSPSVAFSLAHEALDYQLNVINVKKILEAIVAYNPTCKLINFSSAAVYGNPQILPVTESDSTNPISPYGFHKLQSELLLTKYHQLFNLNTCSLRIFSVYGKGLKKQLLWDLYQKYTHFKEVELFGSGKETRDFIHIDDLMQAIFLIIKNNPFMGECINVASGIETSIAAVANNFYLSMPNKITYKFTGNSKPGDPLHWRADISKLKSIGFKPTVDFVTGLKNYCAWLSNLEKV